MALLAVDTRTNPSRQRPPLPYPRRMTDDKSTAADHARVRLAAQERLDYIRWIAAKLLVTDDKLIRAEAAALLRWLTEVK